VEPKTLGWEHSPKRFQKCLQKPWSSLYSIDMFPKVVLGQMKLDIKEEGVGGFIKKALVFLCSRSEQLTRATALPWYGTGPSLKFVCLSAASLILYKGLRYLENMVHVTLESGLSPRMGQYISWHIPSRWKTLGFSRHGTGVTLWRRYCRGMPGR
jgi:hypothetical protein